MKETSLSGHLSSKTQTTSAFIQWAYRMRKLPAIFNDIMPIVSSMVLFWVLSSDPSSVPLWWNNRVATQLTPEIWALALFVMNLTVFWTWTACLAIMDHLGWMDPFRIQPKVPPMPVKEQFQKLAPLVLFNQLFIAPIVIWAAVKIYDARGGPLNAEWPTVGTFVRELLGWAFAADAWFYWTHRTMHAYPWLYRTFHKTHHSLTTPVAVESLYVHPLEYAIASISIYLVGAVLGGCHPLSWATWLVTGTFLQVHDHSGFWLPFLPRALYHDYHHSSNSACFGGSDSLWDHLCGTLGNYKQWEHRCLEGELDVYGMSLRPKRR